MARRSRMTNGGYGLGGLAVLGLLATCAGMSGRDDGQISLSRVPSVSAMPTRMLEPIQMMATVPLTMTRAAPAEAATPWPVPAGPAVVMKPGDITTNIRSGPGMHYPVIAAISAGRSAPITGRSADGEWWRIEYAGREGWIKASVAPVEGDVSAVQVVVTVMVVEAPAEPVVEIQAASAADESAMKGSAVDATSMQKVMSAVSTTTP